jgi:hypothetical protein
VIRRLTALALLALPLTGCLADQKRQAAQCTVDGMRIYPNVAGPELYTRGHYIRRCMGAAGYEFTYADQFCQPNMYDGEDENPYCYRPADAVRRLIFQAELVLERKL